MRLGRTPAPGIAARPQAAAWQPRDWLKLARLVLENQPLPITALFREGTSGYGTVAAPANDPLALTVGAMKTEVRIAQPKQVISNVELPFAARYVEEAPEPDARRLATPGQSGPFPIMFPAALRVAAILQNSQQFCKVTEFPPF